jgi:hypothetical protein
MISVHRTLLTTLAAMVASVAVLLAAPKFTSVWKSPDAGTVTFAGKKVAGLVITQDDSLRISGEESLVRELTGRGLQAVATYRFVPKEEQQTGDRAKVWFEKANVEGVVAMRPVSREKVKSYSSVMWGSPYYSSFYGYYGHGWSDPYVSTIVREDTVVVVETTIYSVPKNQLLWAGVSETTNPKKSLQAFIGDLVKETVKELQKAGLARSVPKTIPK